MDHWPPTDALHTCRVVSRDQTATLQDDTPPTWYGRHEPDFSGLILPPQDDTPFQPTFRRIVDYPPLYSTASTSAPPTQVAKTRWENQGQPEGQGPGTKEEDQRDVDSIGQNFSRDDQGDGAVGGCSFAPPT